MSFPAATAYKKQQVSDRQQEAARFAGEECHARVLGRCRKRRVLVLYSSVLEAEKRG